MIFGFDFYCLVVFLISVFVSIYFLSRTSKILNQDYANKKILKGFVYGSFLFVIFLIAAFIFSSFALVFIGFSAGIFCMTFFTVRGLKDFIEYNKHKSDKITEMEASIDYLKKQPDIKLKNTQALFKSSQKLLEDVSSEFAGEASFEKDIINLIARSYKKLFNADGVVILEADDFEDTFKVKSYLGDFPPPYKLPDDIPHRKERIVTNFKYAEFKPGESIFGKTAASGKTHFIKSFTEDSAVVQNGEEDFLQIGSMVFIPLISRGKVTGVAGLSRNKTSESFTEEDVTNIELFTSCTASVLNLIITLRDVNELNALDNITNTASEIQEILLPKKLKKMEGLEIETFFKQKRGICSDYYDVILPDKDRILIVLADVTGKSIQSAIVMVMIRAILYLIANVYKNAEDILDRLNKGITGKIAIDHFASLSLLSFNPKSGNIEFVAGGNQSMMIFKKSSKEIEVFHHRTDPIGVDSKSKYKSIKTPFKKGDIIALYSDGIVEMLDKNGNQFGINRLAKVIAENNELPLTKIIKKAKLEFESFSEKVESHDDQTLLVIKTK